MRLTLALVVYCTVLIFVALLAMLAGCGVVTSDGRGRVNVSRCDVIVGDELGELPRRHGGPRSRAAEGNGVECRVWKF
jgi:hypothetical protein